MDSINPSNKDHVAVAKACRASTELYDWDPCQSLAKLKEAVKLEETQGVEEDEKDTTTSMETCHATKKQKVSEKSDSTVCMDVDLIQRRALGNFVKLRVTQDQGRCIVSCNCDIFRRDGTCDHSSLIGLIVRGGTYSDKDERIQRGYPPSYCVEQDRTVRWEEVRSNLVLYIYL